MILKIIINIILGLNIYVYGAKNNLYFNDINKPIVISLICIGLSLYILSNLKVVKVKKETLLLINIIYMSIVSLVYIPCIILLSSMLIEYIKIKKYDFIYIGMIVSIYVLVLVKLEFGIVFISLSLLSNIFIYEIMNFDIKVEKLEKSNYDLKQKIYSMEETRHLENKLNSQAQEVIKIEERNILSQQLHDKIGHSIAGSIMQLEALKIVMDNDSEKSKDMIDKITNNLRSGMDDIRSTLRKTKPIQSQLGLNNLKLMLDEFSTEYKIKNKIQVEGDINEINLIQWKVILNSMTEILTNMIKYSNANMLTVNIEVLNKIIRIHIKDNGNNVKEIKKGLGLLGIEERVLNNGGNVYFNNEDGFSTLIVFMR